MCVLTTWGRWETTNLMVAYTTPMEVIEQLRQRMKAYVAQNNREWSNVDVHIDKMEYQNAITLIIAMERAYPSLTSLCLPSYSTPGADQRWYPQTARAGKTGVDAGAAGPSSCGT